jgi:hypothetical protein
VDGLSLLGLLIVAVRVDVLSRVHVAGLLGTPRVAKTAAAGVRTGSWFPLRMVPLVRAGARFEKGKLVERPDDHENQEQVA